MALAIGLLLPGSQASAHRIDEYLQATLLTIESHVIRGAMRLVPGQRVASAVIDVIDTNRDGVFSRAEQRRYARKVLHDLTVSVDGIRMKPALYLYRFPSPARMRDGSGEISIGYTVALRPGSRTREFQLVNHHMRRDSVYLVNVFEPTESTTVIVGQQRDPDQAAYRLSVCREEGGEGGCR